MRIGLGIWSLEVAVLTSTGFNTVSLVLALFLTYSLVVGAIFLPDTGRKSLEKIQEERETGSTAD